MCDSPVQLRCLDVTQPVRLAAGQEQEVRLWRKPHGDAAEWPSPHGPPMTALAVLGPKDTRG